MFIKSNTLIAFVIFVNCVIYGECYVSRTIPNFLIDCYKNGGIHTYAPHNVQLLVELLSKIEQSNSNYNIRVISTSLLHSLRLDGIERAPNIKETEMVIPYRASAFQFSKFSFLLDLLIPGEDLVVLRDGLTTSELCTLHFLISSSVDPWERGDETNICPLSMEGIMPKEQNNRRADNIVFANRTKLEATYSRCPIENGVMQSHWGNISPGVVISGISAALEPQNVKLRDLLKSQMEIFDEEDAKLHKEGSNNEQNAKLQVQDFRKELNDALMTSDKIISNVLAATLTGDIAELAIRQGITAGSDSELYNVGPAGKWDDSILPRYLYLFSLTPNQWEITDAEILAGIDGFIIANYVKEWTSTLERTRLSQIMEMYYSSYGVAFNHNVRACNRRLNMMKLYKDADIYNQTLNLVNALWFKLSSVFITPAEIEIITKAAVISFDNYWPKLLDSLPGCDVKGDTNPMDVIVVTDGSWTKYNSEKLISILSETLDVSTHGSSLGVMHGGTGRWVAEQTHSILNLFDTLENSTDEWPNRLDLPAVLTSLLAHLDNKTEHESAVFEVAGLPLVVILAAPTTKWSENDLENSRAIMMAIRKNYIDIYFVFITPDKLGYQGLAMGTAKNADLLIETSNTDVKEVAEMIRLRFIEKPLPKRIIGPPCNLEKVATVRYEYEDYINFGQKTLYKIHQNYLYNVPVVKVQFQGTDQGEVSVCISRQQTESTAVSCKIITGQYDASFQINHPCVDLATCDPIYFIIKARNTLTKCADKDCRYPDQIRFIIRHEGLQCTGSNRTSSGHALNDRRSHRHLLILQAVIYLIFFAPFINVLKN